MKKFASILLLSFILLELSCSKSPDTSKGKIILSILTASKTGNYYKAGKELNEVLKGSQFTLDIRESPGSFRNIAQLGSGKVDLAIAQFDVIMVYVALNKKFQELANASHVVAPLNYESIHIIVNKKSGINNLKDLIGKKIAVGPKHSGSWISAWKLMITVNKVNLEKTKNIFKQTYKDSIARLAKGEIDAMFITTTTGMPLLKSQPASLGENIKILSLGKNYKIPKALKYYYIIKKIPGNTYSWEKNDVYTFATQSYLLAYRDFSPPIIKNLVAEIFKNARALKNKSEIWNLISEANVKKDIKNKIPYHRGVKSFFGQN